MSDGATTIESVKKQVARFNDERGWATYNAPKNLVMALQVEVAELMEHFMWLTTDESRDWCCNEEQKIAVAAELADIFGLLVQFANICNIDISDALSAKLLVNAHKYPVD